MEEILKTYCVGCSGDYPKVKFVRPEGNRYMHMEGSTNPKGTKLNLTIICTAQLAFFTKEIEEMSFEDVLQQIGKPSERELSNTKG